MENQLKQTNLNKIDTPVENQENVTNSDTEKMSKNVERTAENDLFNFEKSNDDFTEQEKVRLGIVETTPQLEQEISILKEKYKIEKKNLKSSFVSKLKNIAKYTTGSIITLAFTAHFAQKEFPDYLSKEKEPKKIEWNDSTKSEIKKLAHEYALMMKVDPMYKQTPDSVFEDRFENFVAEYGPDIEIVHPGDDMSLGNKIYDIIFEKVLRQKGTKAHDAPGGTLFYKDKTLQKDPNDSTRYDPQTSGFKDFIAEFSHHLNNDWSLRRSFAYAEDLARKGFHQQRMYEDPYSSEYQAHHITENAIIDYMAPDNHNLSVDFADIYNTEMEYYKECVKTRGYEDDKQISWLYYKILYDKKFNDIAKNKQTIFQNLENVRNSIDKVGYDIDKKIKSELFQIIVEDFPLENKNLNSENIALKAKELIILKNKSLENEDSFLNLAKELEERFKNDPEYIYVSMTESFFHGSMIEKIHNLKKNDNQIEYIMKLYNLYLYGTLKAVEGNALGYKNKYKLDDYIENSRSTGFYKVGRAISSYNKYLNNTKESLNRSNDVHSEKIQNFIENYKIGEKTPKDYFSNALEQYIENNKTELDSQIKDFSHNLPQALNSWEHKALLRLQKGLNENHSPNLKRDFFDNGASPLSKILE